MEEEIGKITHYFSKISVGILELTKGKVQIGDTIHIKGVHTDFYQKIESMQSEHQQIESAGPGDEVGIKVENAVREKDLVFLVQDE